MFGGCTEGCIKGVPFRPKGVHSRPIRKFFFSGGKGQKAAYLRGFWACEGVSGCRVSDTCCGKKGLNCAKKRRKRAFWLQKPKRQNAQVAGAEEVAVFHGTNYAKTVRGCCRKIGGLSFQDAE